MKKDGHTRWGEVGEFMRKNRVIVLVALAIVVAMLAILVAVLGRGPAMATLNVTVTPSIATVKIGEQSFANVGQYKIAPGEYVVEVSADGFITKTGRLNAAADEVAEVMMYLEPTAENSDWYETHPEDGLVMGDIKSQMALVRREELREKYPILNYVPYILYTYGIDYEIECAENGGGVCLMIDAGVGLRDAAVQYLQRTGVDLSDYVVRVKDYVSPFREMVVELPEGLRYEDGANGGDLTGELNNVLILVGGYLRDNLVEPGYTTEVLQVKQYGEYFGVKIKVYQGDDEQTNYDTMRMIVGRINGEWKIMTGADWILSKYRNPLVPDKLLSEVNGF
ncbi:hypothetical protein IJ118_03570 [Candidatus Saccharibacteria bacterium]|nr:hypothetical protein [Candidatus Saccharibacteria bacterium]